MKIGLFFGSFNPIHVGHLIIANHLATESDLDQIWLVVSPHNPLKKKSTLANDFDRLHLVNLSIEKNPLLRASDIEFTLPKPSYTIDTLTYLKEKHPNDDFALIMGGDNLGSLHKWKNYEEILAGFSIYVYRRPNYELGDLVDHDHVHIVEAPLLEISSSHIRTRIRNRKSIQYLVTDAVYDYLDGSNMYRPKAR